MTSSSHWINILAWLAQVYSYLIKVRPSQNHITLELTSRWVILAPGNLPFDLVCLFAASLITHPRHCLELGRNCHIYTVPQFWYIDLMYVFYSEFIFLYLYLQVGSSCFWYTEIHSMIQWFLMKFSICGTRNLKHLHAWLLNSLYSSSEVVPDNALWVTQEEFMTFLGVMPMSS